MQHISASKLLASLLILSTALASSPVMAKQQGTLQQCQHIKKRIEHFTELRRSGGSSGTMETWKKHRDRYKDQYSDLRCTKWRNKLR